MDANDNACYLNDRVVPAFFASRLAPTGAGTMSGETSPTRSCSPPTVGRFFIEDVWMKISRGIALASLMTLALILAPGAGQAK